MAEIVAPRNTDEFQAMVDVIEAGEDYQRPVAFALGLATIEGFGEEERVLDVQFTRRNYETSYGTAAVLATVLDQPVSGLQTGEYFLNSRKQLSNARTMFMPFIREQGHSNVETLRQMQQWLGARINDYEVNGLANSKRPILGVIRNWDDAPASVADTYLRLYALSERHKQPNTINLDGIFGYLPNVVITEQLGTYSPEMWNKVAEQLVFAGVSTAVRVLDKFPRMLDHVVPSGVRIADPSRVRLGAHLGEGTTVMHEGFANFNSGTLGKAMVEGRISQGVIVGDESDVGGGASTQGTLSGGGKEKISIGERCLLEANSGLGISLGDDCRVEAGLYVKSTTPVLCPDGEYHKAAELSGKDNMMFRRNSRTGILEMVPNRGGEWGGLNTDLHNN
jgi:2,3,4,5-tetrahydropyridine-2,6-dicarboxylate N-succinyltransferase